MEDPKTVKYETVEAKRFNMSPDDWKREAVAIAEADKKDGTLEFIDRLTDETLNDEPEYEW